MFLTSLMSDFLLGVTCQWLNIFQYTLHISCEHDKYEVLTIYYHQSATSSQPTQEKEQPKLKWSRCYTWLTLWYLFHFHIITTLHSAPHARFTIVTVVDFISGIPHSSKSILSPMYNQYSVIFLIVEIGSSGYFLLVFISRKFRHKTTVFYMRVEVPLDWL